MGARFRSWWQQIKKHRVAIGVVAIVLVVAITLIIVGYWFDWTGFNGYNKITIAYTISGTNAGTVIRTEEYQPGKSLWDWLQLLGIIAIPVVVGFGVAWFTTQQGKVSEAENKDNQREKALQDYIDKMSELLLHENLRGSTEDEEGRQIARVRTLTVFRRLDAERKGSVLLFLHESGLIGKDKRIIHLTGADLREANLSEANLSGTDLSRANLSEANLSEANLYRADLRGADLSWANLSTSISSYYLSGFLREASLSGADLSEADLSGADLSRANLSTADLSINDLSGPDIGSDLIRANLSRVNLSRANLSCANLSEANLSEANLSGAVLSEANLGDTNVTLEQLDQAKSLKDAIRCHTDCCVAMQHRKKPTISQRCSFS